MAARYQGTSTYFRAWECRRYLSLLRSRRVHIPRVGPLRSGKLAEAKQGNEMDVAKLIGTKAIRDEGDTAVQHCDKTDTGDVPNVLSAMVGGSGETIHIGVSDDRPGADNCTDDEMNEIKLYWTVKLDMGERKYAALQRDLAYFGGRC